MKLYLSMVLVALLAPAAGCNQAKINSGLSATTHAVNLINSCKSSITVGDDKTNNLALIDGGKSKEIKISGNGIVNFAAWESSKTRPKDANLSSVTPDMNGRTWYAIKANRVNLEVKVFGDSCKVLVCKTGSCKDENVSCDPNRKVTLTFCP